MKYWEQSGTVSGSVQRRVSQEVCRGGQSGSVQRRSVRKCAEEVSQEVCRGGSVRKCAEEGQSGSVLRMEKQKAV